ncbi:NADH-quinone oxidoreductase subunit NuoE [candidate division KSB3 bacterium]|uniref:NADH-quinone oxidoreductase subunit NuoE n=1 Tax=candidate division KSB3 bacterium TaxID=2044937 RepID=A0A9D5K0D2_9BACT|nr:NADH-quinone oxidoreductase subunit NuoE [candidate division KSB3 bacterium]MBD3327475.1 NADH-quinone oxidoreductase subunit NuoE [candidate division KSB3 bacterium]
MLYAMEPHIEHYQGDRSAVIQVLQDTQKAEGYISKARLKEISTQVGVPYSYTYAIATFYKAFSLQERGQYVIKVCDGTACHLKLSADIVDEIQQHLGIGLGETTEEKLFTLEQVNCLGACAMAPVMSINETLHGQLTRKKVRRILDELKTRHQHHPVGDEGTQPPSPAEEDERSFEHFLEKGKQWVHKIEEFFEKRREEP